MDWIKAHFDCSLEHALLVLRERVKADVEEWKKQGGEGKISTSNDGPRMYVTKEQGPWSTFEQKENLVLVRRGAHSHLDETQVEKFKLIPTVNEAGECRFRNGEAELEFWQASRLILEGVLFS